MKKSHAKGQTLHMFKSQIQKAPKPRSPQLDALIDEQEYVMLLILPPTLDPQQLNFTRYLYISSLIFLFASVQQTVYFLREA